MITRLKIIAFSMLLVILTIYLSYNILNQRMIGTGVLKDDEGQYIALETPAGYWGYGRILAGDIIQEIDGDPAAGFHSVRIYSGIEGASSIGLIRVQPGGEQEHIQLNVAKGIDTEDLLLEFILPICTVLLFAGFSWFVYRSKQGDSAAVYLILFFLSTGLAYLSSFSAGRADPVGKLKSKIRK
ncbi:hypothetical protein [Paenibacillus donghaensis]|uniref:PDZ domain-containing protein n=1 Tax=Paenibacillus donghaensis TaxID=414771 RepID=A0A2Z2KML1_9BACL|nr:hypothetical protein [Paenibacillus donghaensis]ASA24760.1 hypothetical protein B9T62_30790 [Paenibacillus donghaensis]